MLISFPKLIHCNLSRKSNKLLLLVALVLTSSSTTGYAITRHYHQVAAEQLQTNKQPLQKVAYKSTATQLAKDATTTTSLPGVTATTSDTNETTVASVQGSSATKSETQYSTSPDPRSTSYSTTPPAPNPASFDIAITHAHQVAPGTVISYNATKNERIIYGGDLIIDRSTIDYSINPNLGAINNLRFNVSVPDGAIVNTPSLPYNAPASGFWVSWDGGSPTSSFNMILNPYSSSTAPGTYVVHIVTTRSAETADTYEYDGFMTVNVTD